MPEKKNMDKKIIKTFKRPNRRILYIVIFLGVVVCMVLLCSDLTGWLDIRAYSDEDLIKISFKHMAPIWKERKNKLKSVCEMPATKSHIARFTPHPDIFIYSSKTKLSMCEVHKTGNVMLVKIMGILDAKLRKESEVSDLVKYPVNEANYELNIHTINEYHDESVFILVGRNPYDRLLALYVEEMTIVSDLNREVGSALRTPLEILSVGGVLYKCGFDVSFQDFMEYLLTVQVRSHVYHPSPWSPLSRKCAPCNIKYRYIFKYETLANDMHGVFNKTDMSSAHRKLINMLLLHEQDEQLIYIKKYVTGTIISQRRNKAECPHMIALLFKLWESLKSQGLIHERSEFPLKSFKKVKDKTTVIEDTIDIIRLDMKSNPTSPAQRKLQRQNKNVLFNELSEETIITIKFVYNLDFLVFGYDDKPPTVVNKKMSSE